MVLQICFNIFNSFVVSSSNVKRVLKIKFVVYVVFSFYPRQGLCGLFCPMCLLCNISGRMGEGCAYASCCYEVAPLTLRAKLRAEQRIQVRNSFAATCTPVIQAWGWGRGVRNTLSRKGTFLIRSWAGVFSNFLRKRSWPSISWNGLMHDPSQTTTQNQLSLPNLFNTRRSGSENN